MSRARAVALLALLAAVASFVALNLQVGTDITHFMPDRHPSELAKLSTRLADSPFSRTMVLSVEAANPQETVRIAKQLANALREHPEVAWLRAGVEEDQLRELYQLYFPRRLAFLSEDPERELPSFFSHDALRERARQLKLRLVSPAATYFEQSAVADPIGSFERVIDRFQQGEPQLASQSGQFVTHDERFAIVLLGLRHSAFASGPQARLLRDIDAAFEAARGEREAVLEMSGANRFAVAIEQRMKGDIMLIASLSFCGVAGLFFLFVGSVRGFLVVSVPPISGILVATAAALAVFGRIDGLTMAFGASLMGIAIDYSNHLLIHQGLEPAGTPPRATLVRLRPSLILGAATTVASLGGMAVTAFPAFREMSFFAAIGVSVALLVSLFVLPDLLRGIPPLPRRARAMSARFVALHARLERAPRAVLWAPLGLGLVCLALLPRITWQDDMSQLAELDPEMQAEDTRVRQRVGAPESGHFVIGLAPDARSAVALNDAIHADLEPLVAQGKLGGVRSLHSLLWSEELQQRNLDWLASEPALGARVDAAFVAEGFRPGSFAAFERALTQPEAAPLTLADVQASPLGELVRPYSFPLDDRVAVVNYVQGLQEPGALREAVAQRADVHVLDQRTFISDIYGEFRATTLRQLAVGALLVLALLVVRYRDWRASLAAFLPSAIVALLVLGGFALTGVKTNLMHVMSLVMVMGMGVDYGVFLVDSARDRGEVGATMLSLLMSCLTTSFVFGTLALSTQPALRAIGLTTGVGILLAYLLAPITLAAIGVRERGGAR